MSKILQVRGENGEWVGIEAIKYTLTDADKREIANMVSVSTGGVTEDRVLELIQANMPASGDEVSY